MSTPRKRPTTPDWYKNFMTNKQTFLNKLNAISDDTTWDRRFFLWRGWYCSMFAYEVKECMRRIYGKSFSHYKKDEIFDYIKSLEDFDLLIKIFHIYYDMKLEKRMKEIQDAL
jgi:hypothetical protein